VAAELLASAPPSCWRAGGFAAVVEKDRWRAASLSYNTPPRRLSGRYGGKVVVEDLLPRGVIQADVLAEVVVEPAEQPLLGATGAAR
jgi:hypothetical protein